MMDVTSGKAWRQAREEGFERILPSGNIARIRPVEVDFFVAHGKMPDDLAAIVVDLMNGKTVKFEIPPVEQLETIKDQWLPFLNQLVQFAFVSPKVVSNPQADDEISVDDVAYTDKVALYQMFALPAQVLRKFREKQIRDVAAVESKPDDVPAPVAATEDKSVGKSAERNARLLDGASIR